MTIDLDPVVTVIASSDDPWLAWRARRLLGDDAGAPPVPSGQDALGGFVGPSGRPSPGSTGEALCHLALLGLSDSGSAAVASDWLLDARTPAGAWLDAPGEVPGVLDDSGGARVWATAASASGLLVTESDPGDRSFDLLRGDADQSGAFTGGAYPTFAGAAAFWMREGPRTEIAEWALRWAREADDDDWGPWELATALTFWAAAGIGIEHVTVEDFVERLRSVTPSGGWPEDPGLTLRTLEVSLFLGAGT